MDLYSGEPPSATDCLDLTVPFVVEYGEPLEIDGFAWNGSKNALAMDIEDTAGLFILTDCNLSLLNISHDLGLPYGTFNMVLIDWTDDPTCSLMIEQTLSVVDPITSVNMSDLPAIAVRNETQLELVSWLVDGSHVDVSADWEDGSVSSMSCVNSLELSVVVFNYTYDITGTFAVSVIASNLLSNLVTDSQTISIYERIDDLNIDGNTTLFTPPGDGTWTVSAGPDQGPLENIVCVWNMGSNYLDTVENVAWLNTSAPLTKSFSYVEADIGTQLISVNCSNPVSDQSLTMNVSVIPDYVILGELNCTSSTLWNFPIICQLTIVRFGTGACFEWDMGDGTAVVYYQDGYCAASVPTPSPTYIQVQ